MKIKIVNISDIKIKERNRHYNAPKANELAKSIEEIGLLHPVIINSDNTLIAGLHRLKACEMLGWEEIPCSLIDLNNAEELAEIDENLIRAELTEIEKADILSRRKEIFELKYPDTKKSEIVKKNLKQFSTEKEIISLSDRTRHSNDLLKINSKSFAKTTADKIGISSRSILQSIQISKNIAPEIKEKIKDTALADNKTELLMFARIEPDKQRKVIDIIVDKNKKVREAIYQVKKEDFKHLAKDAELATTQTDLDISSKGIENILPISSGDIFQLGNHILVCCDNTSPEIINYLKQYHFAFCFADPPYGAGIADYDLKPFAWNQDYLTDLADIVAVTPGVMSIKSFMRATSMNYRWSIACHAINGHGGCPIGYRHWYYVAIFSNLKNIFKGANDHFSITFLPIPEEDKQIAAQRQKPAGLLTYLLDVFSSQGDFVLDPFAGSGQTLMVCEALNRKCVTIEILPEMVEAIIRRFVNKFPDLIIKKIGNLIDREELNAFR
jgi:ParB family chromosome partitioning protein